MEATAQVRRPNKTKVQATQEQKDAWFKEAMELKEAYEMNQQADKKVKAPAKKVHGRNNAEPDQSEEEAKAACKAGIREFVQTRIAEFDQKEDFFKAGGPDQRLLTINMGNAPGFLRNSPNDSPEHVFDLDTKLMFLDKLIRNNPSERMLFQEMFGKRFPSAMKKQKDVLDKICSELKLTYCVVEISDIESMVYVVPTEKCGGWVRGERVDKLNPPMETNHARPAVLFSEVSVADECSGKNPC